MNEGFGLDDTIKLIFDGEIIVKPSISLNDEEKNFLINKFYKDFHREMRYRLYISKCLETNEINEYLQNPDFLQARAFIFMNRCLNRFDKSRYKGQEFGILQGEDNKLDKFDFEFAVSFKVFTKNKKVFSYGKIPLGTSFKSIKKNLSRDPQLENAIKTDIALARLKFFWLNFSRDSINQLAGETIKWKKNKGIPTKPDLKKSGVKPDEYIATLKETQTYQVNSRTAPTEVESEADEGLTSGKYVELEDELMAGMSREFRRFFFCMHVLKMDHQEMTLEFRENFKVLRDQEITFKKELRKLSGVKE